MHKFLSHQAFDIIYQQCVIRYTYHTDPVGGWGGEREREGGGGGAGSVDTLVIMCWNMNLSLGVRLLFKIWLHVWLARAQKLVRLVLKVLDERFIISFHACLLVCTTTCLCLDSILPLVQSDISFVVDSLSNITIHQNKENSQIVRKIKLTHNISSMSESDIRAN